MPVRYTARIMSAPLRRILEDVRRHAGARPYVVFDLDSTLFSTAQRNLAILREFAEPRGGKLWALVQSLAATDMGWNVIDDVGKRGIDDPAVLAELRKFWRDRFFTDVYVLKDEPSPGSADYVNAVHAAGAVVYYLTGRDVPGMKKGTVESLRLHGFPGESERVILRMKPTWEFPDYEFKSGVLVELKAHTVLGSFENEHAQANLFRQQFPQATTVCLDTVTSKVVPLLEGVHLVKDFQPEGSILWR